jgi:hypothetical protein
VSDGPTVGDIRAGLDAASAVVDDAPWLLAYRAWVLGEPDPLPALAAVAANGFRVPTERSPRHIAALGFAAASRCLPDTLVPVLAEGLQWLAERRWHRPLREATLEVDGVSMLGVALGARAAGGAIPASLSAAAVTSVGLPTLSAFNRSLMVAAAHVMGAAGRPDLSAMLPEARVALADLKLIPVEEESGPPAWRNCLRLAPGDGGAARAALTLRAFDALCERNLPARLGRLEADDVLRVLNGVVRSFREWTWEEHSPTPKSADPVRWHIENEYHVQNMLWAVLAPLFPDLEKEGYTTPVGHKNPRMDLSIPSLKLVVEVKFMRPGKNFADTLEELAADNSLYDTDPRWEVLIPFVWDDGRRTEQHATLVEGLLRMPMVHGAVVMPRPGKMERGTAATPACRSRVKPASSPKPAPRTRANR